MFPETSKKSVFEIDQKTTPVLWKIAQEEGNPATWEAYFDERQYRAYVLMGNDEPLIPWVEMLASSLDDKWEFGAKYVREGGFLVTRALERDESEDPERARLSRIFHYLDFLDREFGSLQEAVNESSMPFRVLTTVLQELYVSQLELLRERKSTV